MKIYQIDPKDRQDVDWFINFPYQLYKKNQLWVPPLLDEARNQLGNHPYYNHSQAAFFLVATGPSPTGEVLGRIAVMDNRIYNEFTRSNTAFWGFFEILDDLEVSRMLLDATLDWARQRGLWDIKGPRNLIGFEGCGVLVEGFEHRPAFDVPYNPPYYERHLLSAGFQKDQDYLSGYLDDSYLLPEHYTAIAEKVKERRSLWVRSFSTRKEMAEWLPKIIAVHDEAYHSAGDYCMLAEDEIQHVIESIQAFGDPRLIKLLMKDESVIGYILVFHDIASSLQKTRGRLLPFGWYSIIQETKHTHQANVKQVVILPEYRGLGGDLLLYLELQKSIRALEFEHVEVVLVNEDDITHHPYLSKLGVHWYKRHRNYKLEFR